MTDRLAAMPHASCDTSVVTTQPAAAVAAFAAQHQHLVQQGGVVLLEEQGVFCVYDCVQYSGRVIG